MTTPGDRSDAHTAQRRSQIVRKLEADGDLWIVREMDAPFDRRDGPHLLFESSTVMRRVRHFPADWHMLDDEALYALSCNIR